MEYAQTYRKRDERNMRQKIAKATLKSEKQESGTQNMQRWSEQKNQKQSMEYGKA